MERAEQLQENLNTILAGLKLDANCSAVNLHRHFAQFDITLGTRTRIQQIRRCTGEIALKLGTRNNPIIKELYKDGIVRLQAVLDDFAILPFFDLYDRYLESKPEGLVPLLLGELDTGKLLTLDMAQNPHLILAGATGMGKSVLLHTIIANIAMMSKIKTKQDVFVYLVDPKRVEFAQYDCLEFQSAIQVVNDYESTIEMLDELLDLMEERYKLLRHCGKTSIEQIPSVMDKYIIIIDEVNDLMLQDDKEKRFENKLTRLAQKSRAAGIYIILATQRPSVKVLTGDIKANFPARISCKTASRVDCQVVLDAPAGSELLAGRGDAIINNYNHDFERFQVAYTTPEEILSKLGIVK